MASENSFGFMAENKNSAVLIPCVACFQTSSNLNPSYTFELIFCLNFLLLLLLFFSISFFFFLFSFFFAQQNPKRKNNNNNDTQLLLSSSGRGSSSLLGLLDGDGVHPRLATGSTNGGVHEAAVVENPLVGTTTGVLLLLLLLDLGSLAPDLASTREGSVNLAHCFSCCCCCCRKTRVALKGGAFLCFVLSKKK